MDSLKGKIVNVVLIVQEAKGMEQFKHKIFISANLNDRVLESDPLPSDDCLQFNTNLIWEIEKKDLRRIRSSNQPLRIDCICVDVQGRQEKFGHVLLDLRSAQIVVNPNQAIYYKWHKLIGIRIKKRSSAPEIYVSLTIRKHEDVGHPEIEPTLEIPISENQPPEIVVQNISEPVSISSIPIKYLEDGYIKVGDAPENEEFCLDILVRSTANLDLLLNEEIIFRQSKNRYCVAIKIFGISIKMKPFNRDLHELLTFDEKIIVNLISNTEILKKFFDEENFDVEFYCGEKLLGVAPISFFNLAETGFLRLDTRRFKLITMEGNGIPLSSEGRQPFVNLELMLMPKTKNVEEEEKKLIEDVVENTIPNTFEEITTIITDTLKEAGDYEIQPEQLQIEETSLKIYEEECVIENIDINQTKEIFSRESDLELDDWKEQQKRKILDDLRNFRDEELAKIKGQLDAKEAELEENLKSCTELQETLQQRLQEVKTAKMLKNMREYDISELNERNQEKFKECDKELLIEYISSLQQDVANLKSMVDERDQEIESMRRTALTKDQTTTLLQELRGLEEKFEFAQKTKLYFKEQWRRACDEIHGMKSEEFKQIQDQIKERREELHDLKTNFYTNDANDIVTF